MFSNKAYVQHILQEDTETIGEMIYSKNGHVYVCGDVTMASDVSKTLTNLLQEYAALSDQEAKDYINKLRVRITVLQYRSSLTIPFDVKKHNQYNI